MSETESKNSPALWRHLVSRRWPEAVCCAALLFLAVNMLLVIREKAVTTDEAFMIPAGYYHVAERDFRPVNEHPPLIKALAGLPLLLVNTAAPPVEGAELRDYGNPRNLYWSFWRENRGGIDQLSFWARVPAVLTTVLLGALLFVYARRLFGARAAAFAVLLFSIEPTVQAHGRVVQTDVPAALGLLLFCFAFYDYVRGRTLRGAAWLGATAGFAVVTKFSMVVLAPVLAATALLLFVFAPKFGERRGVAAAQGAVVALAALLTIQAAYLFKQRPHAETDVSFVESKLENLGGAPLAAAGRAALLALVPEDFAEGVSWQLMHARVGHEAGLLGQYSKHGWWYYFPAAFALKTTLPFLLLSIAGVAWTAWSYARTSEARWLVLLAPFVLYTALVMSSTINIGVRYYLPAYVFLFVMSGALIDRLLKLGRTARRAAAVLVAAAFVWMAVEVFRVFPDQMVYMNQLASARPHWWYLSDSNVEWGDDVKALADYLKARGETEVRASLLNHLLLEAYGIRYTWAYTAPGSPLPPARYVAVSASYLNGSVNPGLIVNGRPLTEEERVNLFAEYRYRVPEKVFGGSIYLYRVRE
jgi:hypothetical protein